MGSDRSSETERSQYDHFIDGGFRKSDGDGSIDVEYPYTGEVWASVPDGTAADVDTAVSVARGTF